MQSDTPVRVLLAFILLCLVVIVAQGFGIEIGAESASPAPTEEVIGEPVDQRFEIQLVRLGRLGPAFMRVDTATGQIWRVPVSGVGGWVEMAAGSILVDQSAPLRPGRLRVSAIPSRYGTILVRVDQQTGRVWRRSLQGENPWEVIGDADASGAEVTPVLEDLLDSSIFPESAESAEAD
jgi:hypothetical protein